MTEFDQWARALDFAFVGIDREGLVGVFYIDELAAVPASLKTSCTADAYDKLTAYLIDDLEVTTEAVTTAPLDFRPYDAERGMLIYTYEQASGAFRRVAAPRKPRPLATMRFPDGTDGCVVRMPAEIFARAEVIRLP